MLRQLAQEPDEDLNTIAQTEYIMDALDDEEKKHLGKHIGEVNAQKEAAEHFEEEYDEYRVHS